MHLRGGLSHIKGKNSERDRMDPFLRKGSDRTQPITISRLRASQSASNLSHVNEHGTWSTA